MDQSWGFNLLMGLNIFKEALKGIGLIFLVIIMSKIVKMQNIYIKKNQENKGEKNE